MRCRALVLAALGAGCVEVPPPAQVVCLPGTDDDGDGWACDARVPDCDEDDDAIHPGADEVAGDGIDQDCLGGDASASELLVGVEILDPDSTPAVQMPGGYVTFPTTGARFPDGLWADELVQVLYDEPGPATGMGIAIEPLFWTSDILDAPRLDVVATGPALGIAKLTWAHDDVGSAMEGDAHLWFFPDGRIVRNDNVVVVDTITGTDVSLSAYLSLDESSFTHLNWSGLTGGVPLDITGEAELWSDDAQDDGWLCLYDQANGTTTGFGWHAEGFNGGPRASAAPGRVTFAWDWVRDATEIPAITYSLSSVTFVGAAGAGPRCEVDELALGLLERELFEPTEGTIATEIDGSNLGRFLYSMTSNGAYTEVTALTGHQGVSLHAQFSAERETGVTVWVDGVRLRAGVDYLRQYGYEGSGQLEVFLYLREVGDGQVIRVAAAGAEP